MGSHGVESPDCDNGDLEEGRIGEDGPYVASCPECGWWDYV